MAAAAQHDHILNTVSCIPFAESLTALSYDYAIYAPWLTFCMLVTKSGCSHVAHLDASTTAAVQKYVAVGRVKCRRGDDLRELLHALGFHIQYV